MQLKFLTIPLILISMCCVSVTSASPIDNQDRKTPLVRAIQNCGPSVVNLRGRKTVRTEPTGTSTTVKQVNGMGTGVVIDSRGYILTNYHVVEGVSKIEVTTHSNVKTTGKLLAHDKQTDLAIIKIELKEQLPVVKIGTSSDLMLAETVAAVGNAYGYEHTVTVGIISQLGRTVQVNDQQIYRNLIQTDAPINPGNSGGPLLNLNGEMIGINVAVRIGAQGIAFAIPVNDAMEVAARLMSQLVNHKASYGIKTKTIYVEDKPHLVIDSVSSKAAAEYGLKAGDEVVRVNDSGVLRELDFYRQLIGKSAKKDVTVTLRNDDGQRQVVLKPVAFATGASALAWKSLGMRLIVATDSEMKDRHPNYQKGLKVVEVRPGSPADEEGIIEGDTLVAMHGWKTESLENLAYILQQTENKNEKDCMFYILRDKEPFWGRMRIASLQSE